MSWVAHFYAVQGHLICAMQKFCFVGGAGLHEGQMSFAQAAFNNFEACVALGRYLFCSTFDTWSFELSLVQDIWTFNVSGNILHHFRSRCFRLFLWFVVCVDSFRITVLNDWSLNIYSINWDTIKPCPHRVHSGQILHRKSRPWCLLFKGKSSKKINWCHAPWVGNYYETHLRD